VNPVATNLEPALEICNCSALRQASRHVTQYYDRYLSSAGLRVTQFSILSQLKRLGPMTINGLAHSMVMDRTTLGRNVLPLQRMGLITTQRGQQDRRSKELRLTNAGAARFRVATKKWAEAQAGFEKAFGRARSGELRRLLRAVVTSELESAKFG
jgi:DNA-binding MarR family transcriptional regulator